MVCRGEGDGFNLRGRVRPDVEGLSLQDGRVSVVTTWASARTCTGLPTRTSRAISCSPFLQGTESFRESSSPRDDEDCFYLTQMAFNLADKYQVPVFVLTDQFLLESHYNLPDLDAGRTPFRNHVVETDRHYNAMLLPRADFTPRDSRLGRDWWSSTVTNTVMRDTSPRTWNYG